MQRVAVFEAVVLADGGARFHGVDGDAGERDFNAADVVGICECRIGRGLISDVHTETDIVRAIIPNCSRGRRQCILNFHDRIQLFVIDFYQIGGVACLCPRFRDNKGDVVADKGNFVFRERQSFRLVHRRAVGPREREEFRGETRHPAKGRCGNFRSGVNLNDPGMAAASDVSMDRYGHANRANAAYSVGLVLKIDVVRIATAASQESEVFYPRCRLAKCKSHRAISRDVTF